MTRPAAIPSLQQEVYTLFPDPRVYHDVEVATVIFDNKVRSMRKLMDESPIALYFKGPKGKRLMTRTHIRRFIEWRETCSNLYRLANVGSTTLLGEPLGADALKRAREQLKKSTH